MSYDRPMGHGQTEGTTPPPTSAAATSGSPLRCGGVQGASVLCRASKCRQDSQLKATCLATCTTIVVCSPHCVPVYCCCCTQGPSALRQRTPVTMYQKYKALLYVCATTSQTATAAAAAAVGDFTFVSCSPGARVSVPVAWWLWLYQVLRT